MISFALLSGLGAALAVLQVGRTAPAREASQWADAALLVLTLALVGARAVYAALNWQFFSAQPLEILRIWQGGFAWQGALLGWGVGVLLFARWMRLPLCVAADGLAVMMTPLAVAVWLGCWVSGCGYGVAAPAGAWWGIPAVDESGQVAARFPLQAAAALLTLLLDWAVTSLSAAARRSGLRAALSLAVLGLTLFAAALFSGQPAQRAAGLPVEAWFALGAALLGVVWAFGIELSTILRKRNKDEHAN